VNTVLLSEHKVIAPVKRKSGYRSPTLVIGERAKRARHYKV